MVTTDPFIDFLKNNEREHVRELGDFIERYFPDYSFSTFAGISRFFIASNLTKVNVNHLVRLWEEFRRGQE